MPLLRLQSSEGKFTTSREIEPVRRSFRRHGSCTFTEVARLVPSGNCKHPSEPSRAGLGAGVVALAEQARDDAAGRVVLVEGVRELLAGGVEVRLELVGLGHESVPLALGTRTLTTAVLFTDTSRTQGGLSGEEVGSLLMLSLVVQTNIFHTEILRVRFPGELPVLWGTSPI